MPNKTKRISSICLWFVFGNFLSYVYAYFLLHSRVWKMFYGIPWIACGTVDNINGEKGFGNLNFLSYTKKNYVSLNRILKRQFKWQQHTKIDDITWQKILKLEFPLFKYSQLGLLSQINNTTSFFILTIPYMPPFICPKGYCISFQKLMFFHKIFIKTHKVKWSEYEPSLMSIISQI